MDYVQRAQQFFKIPFEEDYETVENDLGIDWDDDDAGESYQLGAKILN